MPSDQKVDFNNIKTTVKDVKQKSDEEIEATLTIKALILPKIDEEKLKNYCILRGKAVNDVVLFIEALALNKCYNK